MIEEFPARLLQGGRTDPLVLTSRRAVLGCGCSGYEGRRVDRLEPVTVLRACSHRHDRLIDLAQRALVESLKTPTDRPLVEVVDEFLAEAERVAG